MKHSKSTHRAGCHLKVFGQPASAVFSKHLSSVTAYGNTAPSFKCVILIQLIRVAVAFNAALQGVEYKPDVN